MAIVVQDKDLNFLKQVKIYVEPDEENDNDTIKAGFYSLKELYDLGRKGEVYGWFMDKIWEQLDLKPGGDVQPIHLTRMVKLLRKLEVKEAY